jgi:DNA-binding response OmpR family regulator
MSLEVHFKRLPLSVVVAEKNPLARAALADLLSYDRYQAFQADSLDSAICHINNIERFAVLLADVEMSGWESIVRHAVKTTDSLIIGMVRNHPLAKMHELQEIGIRVCLQKPIIYNEVRTAISANIGARQQFWVSGSV